MADLEGDGFSEIVSDDPKRHGIGGNNPPGNFADEYAFLARNWPADFREQAERDIKRRHAKLFAEAIELIRSEERVPKDAAGHPVCPDADWERKITDMVGKIQSTMLAMDAAREAECRPYDEARNVPHGLFRNLMDLLKRPDKRNPAAYKERLEAALTAFKSEQEKKRRQALQEEADRIKALGTPEQKVQAERAASVAPAELTRTRGMAATSSLQKFLDFKDIDRKKLDLKLLREFLPSDAIEQALRAYLRAKKDFVKDEIEAGRQPLKGVTLFMNERANVR